MSRAFGHEVLALIPARGGSKSIPRKNVLPLNGRPLIRYSIDHAHASRWISRVIVSTDDGEIAEIAKAAGAEVPFLRPVEFAQDHSQDIEFHRHALEWLWDNENYRPDAVVNLRPTHPIRRAATIDRAIETFLVHPEADSLRSVRLAQLSPFKMWLIGNSGYLQPLLSLPGCAEPYNMPRQLLPMVYWQDGYIDVVWARTVLEHNSTTGSRILPFIVEEESVDIDYPEEIAAAERILRTERSLPTVSASAPAKRHPS